MSFREKRAWISLLSVLLVFGFYYLHLFVAEFSGNREGANDHVFGHVFMICVAVLIVLELGLNGLLVLVLPKTNRLPKDELEQLIEYRATKLAYYVLSTLAVIGAAFVVHSPHDRWFNGNLVLLAIFIAIVVKAATQIAYYRKGA